MAYSAQRTDLAAKLTATTRKFLESIEEFKALRDYNTSANILVEDLAEVDLFNGVTGADLLGVINSFTAADGFLAAGFHYTNLNKVR